MGYWDRFSLTDLGFVLAAAGFGLGGLFGWWTTPTWAEVRGPLVVGTVVIFAVHRLHLALDYRADLLEKRLDRLWERGVK